MVASTVRATSVATSAMHSQTPCDCTGEKAAFPPLAMIGLSKICQTFRI
jgi:hypothetical protein